MSKVRVAINGFGRIGRTFYRVAHERDDMEIVAVNDLGDAKNLAYLLQYDTNYGRFASKVTLGDGELVVGEQRTRLLSERNPGSLPWKDLDIDVVVEATGIFASYEKSKAHLTAGAKRVVVSAPVSDDPAAANIAGATALVGVNDGAIDGAVITSNASCTTNAASPLIAILDECIGIEKAILNTTHGYTASQALQDGPSKKGYREGRAAAENIIPSSTGAALAVTKAYPRLSGKFDGISLRVPVKVGSIVDVTFISKRPTSVEEVNLLLKDAAESKRWEGIFAATEDELVSSDIVGQPYASIADLAFTRVVGGNLVKVLAWYDNEMGYVHTLIRHVAAAGKHL